MFLVAWSDVNVVAPHIDQKISSEELFSYWVVDYQAMLPCSSPYLREVAHLYIGRRRAENICPFHFINMVVA